jgi:hypothetical protein
VNSYDEQIKRFIALAFIAFALGSMYTILAKAHSDHCITTCRTTPNGSTVCETRCR